MSGEGRADTRTTGAGAGPSREDYCLTPADAYEDDLAEWEELAPLVIRDGGES